MPSIARRHLPALLGAAAGGTALAALAVPAAAEPAADPDPLAQARDLLRRMHVDQDSATADGPVWAPLATGFASVPTDALPHGAVGGLGGALVTVTSARALAEAIARPEPTVVLVEGSLEIEPFGSMLEVSSGTSILGIGRGAEIVGGGLRLDRVANVVIRNLTFRDSYVAGDWDGKSADNDNDGIRVDTSHHVWIDHCEFARLGDGQVDIRKDSTEVTVSWSIFRDHNKTLGVGWTKNVVTTLTLHHLWFSSTYQRNASIDNALRAHVYSCLLQGQTHYGMMSRGAASLLVEQCVFEDGEDAIVAKDPDSRVCSRGNRFTAIRGRKDHTGETFEASDHYAYTADSRDDVPAIVPAHAGPHSRQEHVGRQVRVALDGSGEFASIGAAVGAAWRSPHPVEIVVEPGVYREVVRVWPGCEGLLIRGATGDAADVVLTYDLAAGTDKFYGGDFGGTGAATLAILSDDVTVRDLTVENAYDEALHGGSQAQALRTVGDRIVLQGVHLLGNQDTFLGESVRKGVVARLYARDCVVEGDVDFIYGRGTMVFEGCEIRSFDRGAGPGGNNGYVAAPATARDTFGILFTGCTFTSSADEATVHLGRPWHPSSDPDVEPSCVVRDSHLGAHIRTPAWSDMSGWPWQEDFLREHANTGPGALPPGGDPTGRPQLTAEEAALHTRETYLRGDDDWTPWA